MNELEISKIENYLRKKFNNQSLKIEARENKDDSAEVMLADEFIGVLFKDVDEGEISYDFHMSILEMDIG